VPLWMSRSTVLRYDAEWSKYSPAAMDVKAPVLPRAQTGWRSFILAAQSLAHSSPLTGITPAMTLGRMSVTTLRPFHLGSSTSSQVFGAWSAETSLLL